MTSNAHTETHLSSHFKNKQRKIILDVPIYNFSNHCFSKDVIVEDN